MSATTLAKTGRRMKSSEICMIVGAYLKLACRHDALALFNAGAHFDLTIETDTDFNGAQFGVKSLLTLIDNHKDRLLAGLLRHERAFGQDNGMTCRRDDVHATENTRTQLAALIGERGTHTDGTARERRNDIGFVEISFGGGVIGFGRAQIIERLVERALGA